MSDLATAPALDKTGLIGGCLRLPMTVDVVRLRAEIDALPAGTWSSGAAREITHRDAGSLFLRGYPPKEGAKPIEDRPVLDSLPYAREIIETRLGAMPLRCLLARLAAGSVVPQHIDQGDYFDRTIRIHVPVVTNAQVWMVCARLCYQMAPGEVWALNNSTRHAVWNADPERTRTHLICDFLPSPALLDLLGRGERDLGRHVADVDDKIRLETAQRLPG